MSCHTPGCGLRLPVCCIVGGRVLLTAGDVAQLGVARTLLPSDRPGYVAELPRRGDGACSELAEDGSCSIEESKPQDCRRQDPAVCPRLRMPV